MKREYLLISVIMLLVIAAFFMGYGKFVNAKYEQYDTELSGIEKDTVIIVKDMKSDRGMVFINKKYYLLHTFRDFTSNSLNYYIKYYDTLKYSIDSIVVKRRSEEKVFFRDEEKD